MDIASTSMTLSQYNLGNSVDISLMKLQMNTQSQMAEGLNKIMEVSAVDSNLGKVIDVRV
ncbi:YjfB family protein [Clostridium sp. 'White wine YQ']|uniref:YjfB family protein n=1 Tax=Clostridium sp. 'White wine YQ' TaxID=3027474 RepID=UPI0023653DA6|nr:YjfB family protein [Clostridium sp. 'White wine YQ']MDD7794464.1 YjfB family protein [Clostridium sp. 'White wine YQ']